MYLYGFYVTDTQRELLSNGGGGLDTKMGNAAVKF